MFHKYLNQAFLCSCFLFYKFYPINLGGGGEWGGGSGGGGVGGGGGVSLLKPKNENMIYPIE